MTNRYGEKNMAPFRHPDHPRPVTRRQFLAQGFISGAAMVAAPSLLGFFARTEAAHAQALDCGIGLGPAGRIPFIVFDLGGGASTAGSTLSIRILDPACKRPIVILGEVARRQLPLNSMDDLTGPGLGVRILRAPRGIDSVLRASAKAN